MNELELLKETVLPPEEATDPAQLVPMQTLAPTPTPRPADVGRPKPKESERTTVAPTLILADEGALTELVGRLLLADVGRLIRLVGRLKPVGLLKPPEGKRRVLVGRLALSES